VLKLSKQKLTLGPMMISARIDQDQKISKDLTMWNQQGSQVLRGQVLVLPIDNTFLYVEPIYLQASQARIPQLQKVVLGLGDRIIYSDTYEQALAELAGSSEPATNASPAVTTPGQPGKPPIASLNAGGGDSAVLQSIREHLRRYCELAGQGRLAEAGKELEAIKAAAK